MLFPLWRLDSLQRVNFLLEFYNNLKSNKKSESLAEAQLAILSQKEHPYFWAGFSLWGYEGMNEAGRKAFANAELLNKFKAGLSEKKAGNLDYALPIFEEAAVMDALLGGQHLINIYY